MRSKLWSLAALTVLTAAAAGPALAADPSAVVDMGVADLVTWGLLGLIFGGYGVTLRLRRAALVASAERSSGTASGGTPAAWSPRLSGRARPAPSELRSSPRSLTVPPRAGTGPR